MKNTYLKETLQRIRPVQYSFDLNIFYFTKCFAQMCLQGVPRAWTLQDGSNHGAGLVLCCVRVIFRTSESSAIVW